MFDILSVTFLHVALNQNSGNWSGQFYIGMILLFFELKVSGTVHSTRENDGMWNYGRLANRR